MKKFILSILTAIMVFACSEEIEIKPQSTGDMVVVEGHIETGLPPYVILTRTQPFFSTTNIEALNSLFIRGADIRVSDGTNTVKLREITTDSLPQVVIDTLSDRLGIKLKSPGSPDGFSLVLYSTLEMTGQPGGTYNLDINIRGQKLSAVTTIPQPVPLDSLYTVQHPTIDSLMTVYVRYTDPASQKNYYRYFTSTDGSMFNPPFFNSVLNDVDLFNVDGKTFDFPIEKGHNYYELLDFNTYTYFARGDSVVLRWCAIDRAHYEYWNTAEFDRASGGNPFSSPTKIKTNIKGGLGVWGGYSPSYHYISIK
jgi:hypothetical protein